MDTKNRSLETFRQQLDGSSCDTSLHRGFVDAFSRLRLDRVLKNLDDPEDPETQAIWEPWVQG